jgi:serine/threonine protein kinase/WD40 repeat protein
MSAGNTCSECGKDIAAESPGGYCAQCMLGLGLEPGNQPSANSSEHDVQGAVSCERRPGEAKSPLIRGGPESTAPIAPLTEKAGDRIGRYRLLREIGHGGCGVVYMAEQEEPVRRTVALKVIKLGMDTKQVVARFEAERQALAVMDHPSIAKVLDAGATESGRPYFVMELVRGLPITDYCDQNKLPTGERLKLFIQVCQAIQHAHQKGIIHRDIKPSNILVTLHDPDKSGVPKVIDFGIAKATQGRLTDQTLFTAFEQFIGTPAYMSPEQAEMSGLDIDTRSDIYSLGVLLYELLVGKTPFGPKELLASGLDQMRRVIREQDPVRPSTRLSTMKAGELTTTAERRRTDPPKLIHLVSGDLDWIVMKCLEKDRTRRYETANGLARDIGRHLDNEPVAARPPSAIYQVHKFIRRNRVIASAATAIATVLVLGIAVSAWEALHARRAEREQSRLLQEAQSARREATGQLWRSYLAEARALRVSGQAGRHFESLAALRKAAAIQPSLALRNEAIAGMVLPDIQWLGGKDFSKTRQSASLQPTLERYAVRDQSGAVSVRRVIDDGELARLPTLSPVASVGTFSQDGRFLPVHYLDGHCRIWDWAKPAIAIETDIGNISDFAPDNRTVGLTDTTNIVLYDASSGKKLNSISLDGLVTLRSSSWLRFDPSSQRLALFVPQAETNVLILDTRTGQTLKTLQHADYVYDTAWHPDGTLLATACADKTIHIWDTTTGERLRMWRSDSCISVGFNHRGNVLASSGWDGYTRLWDFASGRELIGIYKSGHIIGFDSDDLRLGISYWDGTGLGFLEVDSGKGLHLLHEEPKGTSSGGPGPIMDSRGKFLAFRTEEGVGLWDLQTAHQTSRLRLDKQKCLIGFDSNAQNLVLTGVEGLFRCPIAHASTSDLPICGNPILMNADCADPTAGRMGWLSADGKICAIVGDDRCQVFSTETFQKQSETAIQPGMRFIDISPDGLLIASGAWQHRGVKVWKVQTGELVKELPHDEATATVAFSPDNHHLVTATVEKYCFWDVGSWSLARSFPQEPSNDFCPMMAFSPDGKTFAGTHSRNKIRLFDAATGQILADLEAPNSRFITGLAFNRDGTQLAASESQDALRLWDLKEIRKELGKLGLDWEDRP